MLCLRTLRFLDVWATACRAFAEGDGSDDLKANDSTHQFMSKADEAPDAAVAGQGPRLQATL